MYNNFIIIFGWLQEILIKWLCLMIKKRGMVYWYKLYFSICSLVGYLCFWVFWFLGLRFIWLNLYETGRRIFECFDRVYCNSEWYDLFLGVMVRNLRRRISDYFSELIDMGWGFVYSVLKWFSSDIVIFIIS